MKKMSFVLPALLLMSANSMASESNDSTSVSISTYENITRFSGVKDIPEDGKKYAFEVQAKYEAENGGFVYAEYLDGDISYNGNIESAFKAYEAGIGISELVSKTYFDINYTMSVGYKRISVDVFDDSAKIGFDLNTPVYQFGAEFKSFYHGLFVPVNLVHYGNFYGKDTFFEFGLGYSYENFKLISKFSDDYTYKLTLEIKF